jgi:CHASE2 domain-containing sensor protein
MAHTGKVRALLLRLLIRSLAAAIVLFYFGPFGNQGELLRLAHESGASAFSRLYHPLHQEDIAVVLVDDGDLTALHADWPLPYARWSQLLRLLGCAQPGAVFFDMALGKPADFTAQPNPATPAMSQMDQRLNQGTLDPSDCPGRRAAQLKAVPVYYGHIGPADQALPGLVPDARKLPISWEGTPNAYPLSPTAHGASHTSAAYRLFKVACESRQDVPACHEDWHADDLQQSLVPHWTARQPASQAAWRADPEACRGDEPDSFWQALTMWLAGWVKPEATLSAACRPFLTLSFGQVLQGMDADMAQVLQGRVVLIGTQLSGAGDLVSTATHGQLPGVYLHATALENLLTMGSRFERIDVGGIVRLTAVFIVLSALAHTLAPAGLRRLRERGAPFASLALLALVYALAAWGLKEAALCPPGMVTGTALMLTLGVLFGELSTEGRVHQWLEALADTHEGAPPTSPARTRTKNAA